jgi:hypothetical protein
MISRAPLILFAVVALACGGKVDGGDTGDGGTHGSSSGGTGSSGGSDSGASSGGSDAASGVDSPFVGPTPDAGTTIVCQQQGGGGSGGQGSCDAQETETCSDGMTYTVDCSCPNATCTCSESGANGGSSGGGIPFGTCPSCPDPDSIWDYCGFPH